MASRFAVEGRRALTVGVLGMGRLGPALASALAAAGYESVLVASRNQGRAAQVAGVVGAATAAPADLVARSQIVFVTVPDGKIAAVGGGLPWWRGQIAAHCSGARGLEALKAATARGAQPGCLHPLQTFPADLPPGEAAEAFRGIVCGVEGAGDAPALIEAIAADLGARTVRLEGVDRALYHAAAVMVSNDVVALAAAAGRAWMLAGLPEAGSREALAPLLAAAAQNIRGLPLERALTGPLARGDVPTIERHLRALDAEPELRELYRRLASELLRLDLVTRPTCARRSAAPSKVAAERERRG